MSKKDGVTLSSLVVQSDSALASKIEDEVVMMDVERGSYSILNSVGSEIWDLLESPRQVSEICHILLEQYDVEAKSCEDEVLAFLNTLVEKTVIVEVDASGRSGPK